ncbi:hypothetical protein [Emcibacter nanhaiensis]|uniref:Type II secretion system protein GspC N-terminal domain-containing protein n=1 Tax=Emcibacter nanhaiensis TaxID=1505037 RepID=A0A501PI50_9PROT|nr:hypothetical protein [Emcibacter nanhaiensis]TPD60163.1 hypothetical protein FIV46_08895 [Emcibacter nanhaiensis]
MTKWTESWNIFDTVLAFCAGASLVVFVLSLVTLYHTDRESPANMSSRSISQPIQETDKQALYVFARQANAFPLYDSEDEPRQTQDKNVIAEPAEGQPRLMGIIRSGKTVWVILESEDGESREVAVGDSFAGWTVRSAAANSVELEKNGRTLTLSLQTESVSQETEKATFSSVRKPAKNTSNPGKMANEEPEPLKIGKYTIPQVDD